MLLDLNVRQVALKVENVLVVIGLMSEPRKSLTIKPHSQLAVVGAQHVNS